MCRKNIRSSWAKHDKNLSDDGEILQKSWVFAGSQFVSFILRYVRQASPEEEACQATLFSIEEIDPFHFRVKKTIVANQNFVIWICWLSNWQNNFITSLRLLSILVWLTKPAAKNIERTKVSLFKAHISSTNLQGWGGSVVVLICSVCVLCDLHLKMNLWENDGTTTCFTSRKVLNLY